jgi:hypothetical protein
VVEALMDPPDSDRGMFAISVSADLASLHPEALAALTTSGPDFTGVNRVLNLKAELAAMSATIERREAQLEYQRKWPRDR